MMSEHTGKKISTFKDRFTELCESNPKNDSAIASELHVSRQTVHYWKLGERSPKTPTVTAIANYFGVDVAWLMGFDVPKIKAMSWEDEYREAYYKMHGDPESNEPKTAEARIISAGIDKMEPERREQALKVLQTIFADIFDGGEK